MIKIVLKPLILLVLLLSVFGSALMAQEKGQNAVSSAAASSGANTSSADHTKPPKGSAAPAATDQPSQAQPSVEERASQYTDALKQVLNLNPAQYQKLILANQDFISQIDRLGKSSHDKQSFQQGVQDADKNRVLKYQGILNPSQFKTYMDNPKLSGLSNSAEIVKTNQVKTDAKAADSSSSVSSPLKKEAGTDAGKSSGK